jgi:CBS domain-containing protein
MKKIKSLLASKSAGVVTITPDETLHTASKFLAERNIGALVVMEADEVVGILSERDIVRQLAHHGQSALTLEVGDVMTKDIIIALPNDDLVYASNTMTEKRIRHLPVIENGELIGIVSIGDIVKAQLEFYEGEARTLLTYIQGGYS